LARYSAGSDSLSENPELVAGLVGHPVGRPGRAHHQPDLRRRAEHRGEIAEAPDRPAIELSRADLFVMPSAADPFSLCKSANRAVLALANNVPVVATYLESLEPLRDVMMLDDWRAGIDTYLFEPLGMTSTSYRHADYMAAENRASIHAFDGGELRALFERDADPQAPAGGLSSNVLDMAKWLNLIMAGGAVDGMDLFEPGDLLPAVQPQIVPSPSPMASGRSDAYGYGFNVGVTPTGRVMLSHSGGFVLGAATRYVMLPADNLGIVVLTNAAPVGVPEAIAATFIDHYQFGEASCDWYGGFNAMMSALLIPVGDLAGLDTPADAPENPDLSLYSGTYQNGYFGPLAIVEEDGGLVAEIGPAPMRFPLDPWAEGVFAMSPRNENAPEGSRSSMTFGEDANGSRTVRIDYLDRDGLGIWTEASPQ
jgi:hypothetical protein